VVFVWTPHLAIPDPKPFVRGLDFPMKVPQGRVQGLESSERRWNPVGGQMSRWSDRRPGPQRRTVMDRIVQVRPLYYIETYGNLLLW
jgi:hypothetical protein